MRRWLIGVFAVQVLGILFVVLCTFVRRPYETVILNRFGRLVLQQDQARIAYNWYLKWPTDSVERIDTRLHLYTSPVQQVNTSTTTTSGSGSISIQTYAAWRIVDPVKFYNGTGGNDERLQGFLGNALSSAVGQTVSSRNLSDLFNVDEKQLKTPDMEEQIAQFATEGSRARGLTGMRDLGVEIVQVGFSRMAFSPNNADSVYRRMAAEQTAKAQKFLQEGKAAEAELVSKGRSDAAAIRGEALKEAGEIRGKADSDALGVLAAVQQSPEAREFYQRWKSLDVLRTTFQKNTTYVLPTDSPLLGNAFNVPAGVVPAAGQTDSGVRRADAPAASPGK